MDIILVVGESGVEGRGGRTTDCCNMNGCYLKINNPGKAFSFLLGSFLLLSSGQHHFVKSNQERETEKMKTVEPTKRGSVYVVSFFPFLPFLILIRIRIVSPPNIIRSPSYIFPKTSSICIHSYNTLHITQLSVNKHKTVSPGSPQPPLCPLLPLPRLGFLL